MTGFTYFCIFKINLMRNILVILLLFYGLTTKEQVVIGTNLVNNPSFEDYDTCPANTNQLYRTIYWWGLSSDYFNACSPSTFYGVSVPLNGYGYQYAHTGNAYAGVGFSTYYATPTNYREAIKTKLNNTLIANKRYCTKYYVSLAEYSYLYPYNLIFLDSLGMLFTNDSIQDTTVPVLNNGVKFQNSLANIDTINWLKISNSFIANGGEQYLTISNFDSVNNYTATSQLLVYVDDVSVCECSFNFSLGNDTTLCIGQSLTLSPNMPNATYTWQYGSTDSTYTVTQAGTYWVKAYFAEYGITTYDSINIMYKPAPPTPIVTLITGDSLYSSANNNNQWYCNDTIITGATNQTYLPTTIGYYYVMVTDSNGCSSQSLPYTYTGIEELIKNNVIYVYPNPAKETITITFDQAISNDGTFEIWNIMGSKILSNTIPKNYTEQKVDVSNLISGIYFYIIKVNGEKFSSGKLTIINK